MASQAASVVFRGVTKRYGAVAAVDDVSFIVAPGSLVTLLGPSGCGKTTTLRLIAGLEMASTGAILIGEDDVTQRSAAERGVSMVFQSYALFPHMSVIENVAYGPLVGGTPKKQAEAMAAEKLATLGLAGFERRLPSELSGGQQQRVAVARALVLEPRVLLFDEPLSNLDAKLRRKVREDIRELQQRLGLTVIYVTHDQQEALAVSDRVIVMANAVIAQTGTPRELYAAPASRFVAEFIGEANLLTAEIVAHDGGLARTRLGPILLDLPHRDQAVGPALVAVRPEAIRLVTPETGSMAGTVAKAAYLGSHMEYAVTTAVGELFVIDRDVTRPHRPGAGVGIVLDPEGATLVPA